jgi:hypothetical protein
VALQVEDGVHLPALLEGFRRQLLAALDMGISGAGCPRSSSGP